MKKTNRIISVIMAAAAIMPIAACGGTPSDGKTEIDSTLFNEYAHENIFETTVTEKGLKMTGTQNLRAACSKMRFAIEEKQKISLTFTVPVYEENSEEFLTSGINMYTKTCVDVMMIGQTESKPVAQLRLWAEKTAGETKVHGRVGSSLNGESSAYDGTFINSGRPYADTEYITGNMRESAPFTIVFDKENFFQSYLNGETDEIKPVVDKEKGENEKKLYESLSENFKDVKSVSVVIRFSGLTYEDLQKKGYTGFEASSLIYITEINGQTLKSSDGRIKDETAPYISTTDIIDGRNLKAYSDYVYEVKSNESAEEGRETVLYSAFATDVLSWKDLKYKVTVTDPDGKETTYDGLNFSTGRAGTYKVKVTVTDASGNAYTSPEKEFIATDSYRINVEGTLPETAKKGSEITIPSAYVTNADGSKTDKDGNPYAYTVKVMNPLEMEETIVNGKVTLKRSGVYTIRYTSESADGRDTKEFRIRVS